MCLIALTGYAIFGAVTGIRHESTLSAFYFSATWGAFGQLLGGTWIPIGLILGLGLQHRYRDYHFKGVNLRKATLWTVSVLLAAMFVRALVYDGPKIDAKLWKMNLAMQERNQQAEMLHVLVDRLQKLSLREEITPEQLAAISRVMAENLPPRAERTAISKN